MARRAALLAGAALAGALILAAVAASQRTAFPGKNGKIAYADDRDFRIRLIGPNGQGRIALPLPTTYGHSEASDPDWSPSGDKLLFTALWAYSRQLYVTSADGTVMDRLTGPQSISDKISASYDASWSADGRKIVFIRDAEDGRPANVFVANADGSNVRRLTSTQFGKEDRQPVWSPRGEKIAFVRVSINPQRPRADLYVVNPDGTGLKAITKTAPLEGAPDWSPDGSKLVFVRVEGRGGSQHGSLYVINADGSGVARLTNPNGSDIDPAWSPDGRQIVFARGRRPAVSSRDRAGLFDLYVINTNGSGLRRLTSTKGSEVSPDWQPLPAR